MDERLTIIVTPLASTPLAEVTRWLNALPKTEKGQQMINALEIFYLLHRQGESSKSTTAKVLHLNTMRQTLAMPREEVVVGQTTKLKHQFAFGENGRKGEIMHWLKSFDTDTRKKTISDSFVVGLLPYARYYSGKYSPQEVADCFQQTIRTLETCLGTEDEHEPLPSNDLGEENPENLDNFF